MLHVQFFSRDSNTIIYLARTFSTYINNRAGTFFRKHIRGKYFFVHFYELFFAPDTICGDNKDKPMVGSKNQSIKKVFEKFIAANICHIKFIFYIIKFTIVNILV